MPKKKVEIWYGVGGHLTDKVVTVEPNSKKVPTWIFQDDGSVEETQVPRVLLNHFKALAIGTALLLAFLIILLFFFIYNYSYTQFISTENKRLLLKNYELNQKLVHLNENIESEVQPRIEKLDKANATVDSIKKYLNERGANVDNDLKRLANAELKGSFGSYSYKTSYHLGRHQEKYNAAQLEYLYASISGVPLGYPYVGRITSPFGYRIHPIHHRNEFHEGIDIAGSIGAPVATTADGVVSYAGQINGYGNVVKVEHKFNFSTTYAHLSAINVKNHQMIKAGEIIGRLGSTGHSTGPHVHYEVRHYGQPLDPKTYLSLGN